MNELYDINSDELLHYGRKGMKWGQHIFGKVRMGAANLYAKRKAAHEVKKQEKAAEALRKKPLSKLTDAELKARIDRLTKEKQAYDLEQQLSKADPKKVSLGKTFMQKAVNDVAVPAAVNAGKEVLERWLKKKGYDLAGLKDTQYAFDAVAKAAQDAKNVFDSLNYKKKANDIEREAAKREAEQKAANDIQDRINKAEKKNEKSEKKAAKQAAKQARSEEREANKVYTGTVSGEGTSRSDFAKNQTKKNRSNKTSRSYDGPIYSDFVNKDTPVSNVRNTESYSVGIDYIQRLLLN